MPRPSASTGRSHRRRGERFLQALEHSFWTFHYTLTSKAAPKESGVIGESRTADIRQTCLFHSGLRDELRLPPRRRTALDNYSTAGQYRTGLETAATRLLE